MARNAGCGGVVAWQVPWDADGNLCVPQAPNELVLTLSPSCVQVLFCTVPGRVHVLLDVVGPSASTVPPRHCVQQKLPRRTLVTSATRAAPEGARAATRERRPSQSGWPVNGGLTCCSAVLSSPRAMSSATRSVVSFDRPPWSTEQPAATPSEKADSRCCAASRMSALAADRLQLQKSCSPSAATQCTSERCCCPAPLWPPRPPPSAMCAACKYSV